MLGVQSLESSLAFYRDRLGLKPQGQIPGYAFIDAGGITLCLSEPLRNTSAHPTGAIELVFPVEHVRAAYDALRSRGVGFSNEPRNITGTNWAANFLDPDGHQLSIFGPE